MLFHIAVTLSIGVSFFLIAGCCFAFVQTASRELLHIAPIVGGAIAGIALFNSLLLTEGDLKLAGVVVLAIVLLGTAGWGVFLKKQPESIGAYLNIHRQSLVHAAVLFSLCTIPLVQHVVPPDVDAQYSTTLAAYLLAGDSYPVLGLAAGKSYGVILPDTFGLTLAVLSQLWPGMLTKTSISLASAWSALTLIALLPIAHRLLGEDKQTWLGLLLVVSCGYSAAFIWNFGDGSYIRTPAIAVMVAIPILFVSLGESKYRIFAIAMPILIASVFYSHQRYAILASIYLATLGLSFLAFHAAGRRLLILKVGAIAGLASAALLLPLLPNFVAFMGLGQGTPIGNIEVDRSIAFIYENYLFRFHSIASWVIVGLGIIATIKAIRHDIILTAAALQILIFLYFITPPLASGVTPALVPLIYARVVALDPVLFGKFCFCAAFLASAARFMGRRFTAVRLFGPYPLLLAAASVALIALIVQTQSLYAQNAFFRLRITELLPTPFLTYWFAFLSLAFAFAAIAISWTRHRRNKRHGQQFPVSLIVFCAVFWAVDIHQGKFNYQYYAEHDLDLAVWLRENTEAERTLIFKGCNLDPFGTDIRLTRPNPARDLVIYNWGLDWLPALAGRKTVCNRLHFVGYKSRIFGETLAPPSAFYDAHQQLFGSQDVRPGNHFAALGVTHVVVNYKTLTMRGNVPVESPFLRQVYQQDGLGYTVYQVTSD